MYTWTCWLSLDVSVFESARHEICRQRFVDAFEVSEPSSLIVESDCTPPVLSTSGGRRLFKRLSDAAGIDTSDDSKDYLTLHGGRRDAGEMYYREAGHSAAQRALRHVDPSTTSEMYSHIEASELSKIGSEVFDDER